MKYCEKCGQELSGSVCGFCGQASKPKDSDQEHPKPLQKQKTNEQKRFRWLRSDRPKRYLAEMALLSLVALIAVFVIVPGLQGQPQLEAEIDRDDSNSTNPQQETEEIPAETEKPQSSLEEESNPPEETEENESNLDEPQGSLDEDPYPPALDESIYDWIETWYLYQDDPFVEDGASCFREPCVFDNFRVSFEPIENFGLEDIEGSIEMRTEKDTRLTDSGFQIQEGQTEITRQFLVQDVDDLRNYDGDYYFNFIFWDSYELISFDSDGREFDLLLNEGDCYRTSEIWWQDCGAYAAAIVFDLPTRAENGPHGYPVGYYDIPAIGSCDEIESIGYDISGWAATFQAARSAGATQAFVSTQYYAKLFELDTNLDGIVCSSQVPE